MTILLYPADQYGCGHHRLIWPCEVLRHQGHADEVAYVPTGDRRVEMGFDDDDVLQWMRIPEGVDVVVFQRITDVRLLQAVTYLRERGVAVVIDVDDDLSSIHPSHPGFLQVNPNRAKHIVAQGVAHGYVRNPRQAALVEESLRKQHRHSFLHLEKACQLATLVTVSTPGLLKRYAAHGRGRVLENYVPDHYLDVEHEDSAVVGWPASINSHPNDPPAVGNAIRRLVDEGIEFVTIGEPKGAGVAFGLRADPPGKDVELDEWPHALARLGVGIACLADTLFNSRKSWLKLAEMSAVGVPWVASARAEYRRFAQLNGGHAGGVLVDKPKHWYRELRRLVDDPARRAELSLAGRDVALGLRLSDHAWRHLEAWSDAREIQRGTRSN